MSSALSFAAAVARPPRPPHSRHAAVRSPSRPTPLKGRRGSVSPHAPPVGAWVEPRAVGRYQSHRRRVAVLRRAGEGEGEGEETGAAPQTTPPAPEKEVKSDPFGFGSSTGEPDKIMPGFDTAEGGKVGPVGTFFISLLLFVLFGASLFFTSVPRNAIVDLVDLSDDPNAPTNTFR